MKKYKYVELYNLPSDIASSNHFYELLSIQEDSDLKLAPKLNEMYSNRSNHFQKMRVKSASHVLSHDVGTALRYLAEEISNPDYISMSWLLERFAKWFKIMTARNLIFALSEKI